MLFHGVEHRIASVFVITFDQDREIPRPQGYALDRAPKVDHGLSRLDAGKASPTPQPVLRREGEIVCDLAKHRACSYNVRGGGIGDVLVRPDGEGGDALGGYDRVVSVCVTEN